MFGIERRLVTRALLILAVLVFMGVLAGVNYYFQRDLRDLATLGKPIEAVINNKNCANAGVVYYGFALDGSEYRGSGNACVASCAKALVGEKIQVTYSVKNPQNSMCGSVEQAVSRFNGNYYALLLVGIGLLVVAFRSTRRQVV